MGLEKKIDVVIATGELTQGHQCRKRNKLEIYSANRFLTITGATSDGCSNLRDANTELNQLYREVFFNRHKLNSIKVKNDPNKQKGDRATVDLGFLSNPKIKRLYDGNVSSYPSHLEADLALCSLLTKNISDPQQIDRLFRKSKLYQDKWDMAAEGFDGNQRIQAKPVS